MELSGSARLVRIFLGESDLLHGVPLFEKIVMAAKESGLAGATVTKGLMGYGSSSMIHTSKILRLSEDLPVVVEIVDTEEKTGEFLPLANSIIEECGCGGIITIEKVEIIRHKPSVKRKI